MINSETNLESFFTFAKPTVQLPSDEESRLGVLISNWDCVTQAVERLFVITAELDKQISNFGAPSPQFGGVPGTFDPHKNTRAQKIINQQDYFRELLKYGNSLISTVEFAMNSLLTIEEKELIKVSDINSIATSKSNYYRKRKEILERLVTIIPI